MKCSNCDGEGVIYINKVDKNGYFNDAFFMKECPVCHGTGKVQTNEEWFCGLSTEEKAEWLCSKEYYCEFIDGCNYCPLFEADKHRCLDLSNKELWELWLKAKHDSEEK